MKCIICDEAATHTVSIGLTLPTWQGKFRSSGQEGVCDMHVKEVQPVAFVDVISTPALSIVKSNNHLIKEDNYGYKS